MALNPNLPCSTLAGDVNAHTHMYSGLASLGMPAPVPAPRDFSEILSRVWWRLDRALDEASLRASARYYAARAVLFGATTLVDHHESPQFISGSLDLLADACQEIGIRAVLCYGVTERNGGREEAVKGLAECERFLRSNRRPLVRGAVGLHASFTVSDATLTEAGRLARRFGAPVHVHVAEDVCDVEDARQRGYPGPLERLLSCDALPSGSILAHGVHLGCRQVRMAEESGCWLVQNPRSNEANRVGYPRALANGTRVALGTDGFDSEMRAELSALRRLGAAVERVGENAGDPVAALDERFTRRLEAGHELASRIFGLDVAESDQVTWKLNAAGSCAVEQVVLGDRVVVDSGRLVDADMAQIRTDAEREAERLWIRMGSL